MKKKIFKKLNNKYNKKKHISNPFELSLNMIQRNTSSCYNFLKSNYKISNEHVWRETLTINEDQFYNFL